MAITLAAAASTLEHYIRAALEAGGVAITSDMQRELTDAVASFREADADIERLQRQASVAPGPSVMGDQRS